MYPESSSMPRGPGSFYDRFVKRVFDVTMSSAVLVAAAPFLGVVALAVRKQHGSPVLFQQTRTGKDGEPFQILKFRTMTNERGPDGELLPDKQRLTALGRWLRSTSIDELPELLNVLRGEMSLVGPRPLLHHYVAHYSERQNRRHECRPGITGWVAVYGRNTGSWADRFELDVHYVENLGPVLDLVILFRTFLTVVGRKGIDPAFADQMPEFRGT